MWGRRRRGALQRGARREWKRVGRSGNSGRRKERRACEGERESERARGERSWAARDARSRAGRLDVGCWRHARLALISWRSHGSMSSLSVPSLARSLSRLHRLLLFYWVCFHSLPFHFVLAFSGRVCAVFTVHRTQRLSYSLFSCFVEFSCCLLHICSELSSSPRHVIRTSLNKLSHFVAFCEFVTACSFLV